jgi:Na+/H+ antiporter NhaC
VNKLEKKQGSVLALFPLVVFLSLFIGSGVMTGDFYQLPVLVAALLASAVALVMNRKESFGVKVERFAKGAGHPDIMIMVLIFLLAGAFSGTAKGMGAVESTVNLALSVLPQNIIIAGLFVIAAFISLSMGTSMGTIAALAPIGVGIGEQTGISLSVAMAAVVGGAMFGDNLSIISDTTIAAVRSQQTKMKDKFKTNFFIVLPAAIVTILLFIFVTSSQEVQVTIGEFQWVKVLPYVGVLIAAIAGVNVIAVLAGGIVLAGAIGLVDGSYTLSTFVGKVAEGLNGMAEIVILTMLIGGIVEIIKHNGGIQFLLNLVSKNVRSPKGAQFSIAGLVSATNFATANNTISIIVAGPLAKQIADQYDIDARKSASILDIFSCAIQGIIPYGAQLLVAAQMASLSPLEIIPFSFYPMLIALCGALAIVFNFPSVKAKPVQSTKEVYLNN